MLATGEFSSCISVGSSKGFKIYNCDPFGKCYSKCKQHMSIQLTGLAPLIHPLTLVDGGIGIVEMLFCTSLVALVGAGEQPAFSPRRLQIMNTKVGVV